MRSRQLALSLPVAGMPPAALALGTSRSAPCSSRQRVRLERDIAVHEEVRPDLPGSFRRDELVDVHVPGVCFVGDVHLRQPEVRKDMRTRADLVARRIGAAVGEDEDFDVVVMSGAEQCSRALL